MMNRAHKNSKKFLFYLRSYFYCLMPSFIWSGLFFKDLKVFCQKESSKYIEFRVSYYNSIVNDFTPSSAAVTNNKFKRDGEISSYFFDMKPLVNGFPEGLRFDYIFGDVRGVPDCPAFVKSRPICTDNSNSVLLKLNSVRHYYFYPDKFDYDEKKPYLVWRGASHQPHRKFFVENFYNHPMCNVGDVHKKSLGEPWHKDVMSIKEQLKYKFILSIEGNEVATNLKWIMASNSLCFMTKPKFETWFMEGTLQAGVHYVELKDDYSDLEAKITYYREHPEEAKRIIGHANAYVAQFMDEKRERLIGLLVMRKYFEKSGQLPPLL
ncbi:glycosyltransferase family 90 protein [Halomonas sediminis]